MSESSEKAARNGLRMLLTGVAVVLVLAGLIALFFNRLAAGDLILARGDTLLYFYPYWQAASEALRAGSVPLWNPYLFMGAPLLANSQVGFFYPLNWPFWLLLATPYAATLSIMLHLLIASVGVYLMGRRCLSLSRDASLLAAILFSLGGYLTAQVEHINQVQGIAWLPWYFVVLCPWQPAEATRRRAVGLIVCIAAILSLQILSGHTQTVFISLTAVAIWLILTFYNGREKGAPGTRRRDRIARVVRQGGEYFGPVVAGVLLAGCMTAIQLLPTLELSRHSLRQGGLPVNEVLSFSLQPLLLGHSLLPAYGESIFSEYVVFVPILALLLAAIGARRMVARKEAWPFLIVAVTGLVLALGRFNPAYHLLARLPGFNLFRAPARWSVLYALVIALLAAAGWQILVSIARDPKSRKGGNRESKALVVGSVIVIGLIAWSILSPSLVTVIPSAPEAVVERPANVTIAAWVVELILAFSLIYLILRGSRVRGLAMGIMLVVGIMALYLGTRSLPYNQPTTPEAYFEYRAPVSHLLAKNECAAPYGACFANAGRVLGLSDIFFDVGDQAEIETIYGEQLGQVEYFDYIVASKQKEILGPNLPLKYALQSVDGFDGGVLPLDSYASAMRLILPDGVEAFDGRLREHLDSIPDARWLDLFGARYVITDKVGDEWRRGVFFDMKHPTWVTQESGPIEVGSVPQYEATEIWLLGDGPVGEVGVTTQDGDRWLMKPKLIEADLWRVQFPTSADPQQIILNPCWSETADDGCGAGWHVRALALVDARDETFMPMVAGNYQLVHSGDVKIYENTDLLPRAFLIYDWQFVKDNASGLAAMRADSFDPSRSAVILGQGPTASGSGNGDVSVLEYLPERIVLHSDSDELALLLLTDAFYPGWQATIGGEKVEIMRSDILFRGLFVPPGENEVVLEYLPASYDIGRVISLLGLVIWILLAAYVFLPPYVQAKSSSRSNETR